jgi:hypothetical protein
VRDGAGAGRGEGRDKHRHVEEVGACENEDVPDLVAMGHKVKSAGPALLWNLQRVEDEAEHVASKGRQQLVEK